MPWTRPRNVWSPDPADTNGEKNIQLSNMLGSTQGISLPMSAKEDAAVHKMLSDRLRGAMRWLGQSGFSTKGAFSFSGGYPANSFQVALSELIIDGLPVMEVGTGLNSDANSQYTLPAPPGSGTRNDLVFLEMFLVEVPGSTNAAPVSTNKPDSSHVFKWGNVLYGGTNITDDINEASFEIRRRVQIQYRIRTIAGVNFGSHPNGIDDTSTVFAQGPQAAPTGLTYAVSPTDAGLYIAGNGSVAHQSTLGTLDGYVYAIPIAQVARTTSTTITSGNVTDLRMLFGGKAFLPLTGGNMTGGINESISTVASGATPDIWTGTGNVINYTGTTSCSGFAAAPQAGTRRVLVCAGAAPFVNGANLLLPGGANYTASAGDLIEVLAVTTTQFRLTILKADGTPITAPALTAIGQVRLTMPSNTNITLVPFGSGLIRNAGTLYQVPAGGVTCQYNNCYINGVGGQTTAGSTLYHVYHAIIGGNQVIDLSATAHSMDSTAGNIGTEIKSGDNSRTYLGMVYTGVSGLFLTMASWFNRSDIVQNSNPTGTTASSSFTALQAGADIYFLTFAGEGASWELSGAMYNSVNTGQVGATIGVDSHTAAAPGTGSPRLSTVSTGVATPVAVTGGGILTEGVHYASALAYVGSSGTFNAENWYLTVRTRR